MLTDIQKEILIGSLLGDGHLGKGSPGSNARFKIDRSQKDADFFEWELSHFKEFCGTDVKYYMRKSGRSTKEFGYCRFRTLAKPEFTEFYNKWYINKIRVVPDDL